MDTLGSLLKAIETAGYALDTPGAYTRGLLAGRPGERKSGADLAKAWGIDSVPGAGLGLDLAVDPLNLAGAGLLGKLGAVGKAAKAARIAKTTEELANISKAVKPIEPAWKAASEATAGFRSLPTQGTPGLVGALRGELPSLRGVPRITRGGPAMRPMAGELNVHPNPHYGQILDNPGFRDLSESVIGADPMTLRTWSMPAHQTLDINAAQSTHHPWSMGVTAANPFYSRVQRAVEGLQGKSIKGQSLLNQIRKAPGGVSEAELAATQLPELAGNLGAKSIPVADLHGLAPSLNVPQVRITQQLPAKYGEYVTKPAKDYAETLFQNTTHELPTANHPHFTPETIAHLRTTTRQGPQGPAHFIDELQSELFQGNANIAKGELRAIPKVSEGETAAMLRAHYPSFHKLSDSALIQEAERDAIKAHRLYPNNVPQVFRDAFHFIPDAPPSHPLSGEWQNIALKKALTDAARAGSPGIGWNQGSTIQKLVGGAETGQNAFYDKEIGERLYKLLASKGQKGAMEKLEEFAMSQSRMAVDLTRSRARQSIRNLREARSLGLPESFKLKDVQHALGKYKKEKSAKHVAHYIPLHEATRQRILKEGWPLLATLPFGVGLGLSQLPRAPQPGAT